MIATTAAEIAAEIGVSVRFLKPLDVYFFISVMPPWHVVLRPDHNKRAEASISIMKCVGDRVSAVARPPQIWTLLRDVRNPGGQSGQLRIVQAACGSLH